MKPFARVLSLASLGFVCAGVIAPPAAIASDTALVLGQDLKQLRVPDKVSAVLWTKRKDFYTLQLVLPVKLEFARTAGGEVNVSPPIPATVSRPLVWLLRSDGTLVMPVRVSPPNTSNVGLRTQALEASYSFPLVAGEMAVAVAMKVDDEFYIEKLEPINLPH